MPDRQLVALHSRDLWSYSALAKKRRYKLKYRRGDTVGSFRLLDDLGSGGNGEVWKVRNEPEERGIFALKILHPSLHNKLNRYARFRKEATTQKQLSDEGEKGVLPVIDFSLPETPNKQCPPWIRTPIATPSISDKTGKYDVRDVGLVGVVKLVSQIAETLTGIEKNGIFHRDIKPENIFLYDGQWVLGDFGLVKTLDESNLTVQGEVVGPAAFIAPEMRYGALDAEPGPADVYSLGKMFWYLSSDYRDTVNVPGAALDANIPRLTISYYNPEHINTGPLDLLVQQSTLDDPAKRPSMTEFSDVLKGWRTTKENDAHKPIDLSSVTGKLRQLAPAVELAKQKVEQKNSHNILQEEMYALLQRSILDVLTSISDSISTQHLPNILCSIEYQGALAFRDPEMTREQVISQFLPQTEEHSLGAKRVRGLKLSATLPGKDISVTLLGVAATKGDQSLFVKYGYASVYPSQFHSISSQTKIISLNPLLIEQVMDEMRNHAIDHMTNALSYLADSVETALNNH